MARGGAASTSGSSSSRAPVARLARQRSCARPSRFSGSSGQGASNSGRMHRTATAKAVPSSLVYDSSPYERELRRQASFMPSVPLHLVLPKNEHKECLQNAVHEYYDVWNYGSTDGLNDLVQESVTYCDVLRSESDYFGRACLKQLVGEFTASHPLIHFEVEDVMADADRDMAVAHWRATSADLLPHADGSPASGRVSEIHGMDKFVFDGSSLMIKAIMSYRERFEDEDVTPMEFDE